MCFCNPTLDFDLQDAKLNLFYPF